MQTKRCSKCKKTKPTSEFYKNRRSKDGLTYDCKLCAKESSRRYYEANGKKVTGRSSRQYQYNKDQVKRVSSRCRKIANERSLELAYRQGFPWEDWEEVFVLADNGLTHYQKAIKLGRSLRSVKGKRVRLRKKARNELTNDTVRVQ